MDGSPREDAATPPASTSPFLLPLAEAAELPGELVRAPRSPGEVQQVRLTGTRPRTLPQPGLALVRMPEGRAAGVEGQEEKEVS